MMNFGSSIFGMSPVGLAPATPLADMPGITQATIAGLPGGNISAPGQSPWAMLGQAFQQQGGKDTPGLPPLPGPMQHSNFGANLIQQLMASFGQHNMLGRIGQ